jgi:integrase
MVEKTFAMKMYPNRLQGGGQVKVRIHLAGIHPKIVSERLRHANIGITLDIYSHVLPGLQEAAAGKFNTIFEADFSENSESNVSKMLADGGESECRPCRSRTCDALV